MVRNKRADIAIIKNNVGNLFWKWTKFELIVTKKGWLL